MEPGAKSAVRAPNQRPRSSASQRLSEPYHKRQVQALVLLALSVVGLIGVAAAKGATPADLRYALLLHAFEGALVGALCDWWAVSKTYRIVEANRNAVALEIGDWVQKELLSHRVISSALQEWAHSPEARDNLYLAIDRLLGTPSQAADRMLVLWRSVEETVLGFVGEYDLSSGDLGTVRALLADPGLDSNIKRCLGEAMIAVAESSELEAFVRQATQEELGWVMRALGVQDRAVNTLRSKLRESGMALRDGRELATSYSAARPLGQKASEAYIAAWNALAPEARRQGAALIAGHLARPLAEATAKFLCGQRDQIRQVEKLAAYEPVKIGVAKITDLLGIYLTPRIGALVSGALTQDSPRAFRASLERKTRAYLETIRINGTVLGFGIGAAVGLLLSLFHS